MLTIKNMYLTFMFGGSSMGDTSGYDKSIIRMLDNGIKFIPVRRCSLCGDKIGFRFTKNGIRGDYSYFFDSGCQCGYPKESWLSSATLNDVVMVMERMIKEPDYEDDEIKNEVCGMLQEFGY